MSRGDPKGLGKLEDGDEGGLLAAGFQQGNIRAVQAAFEGDVFLRIFFPLPQFPDDFPECRFNRQSLPPYTTNGRPYHERKIISVDNCQQKLLYSL